MPVFGQPTSREHRREWWRRQLARQESANLSVTEFCRQLGVSVTTFYYWKKRIHSASPTAPTPISAGYTSRKMTAVGNAAANFVPVSILAPAASTELEIELTNACVVRLKGAVDPLLLQAAITAAGQLDGPNEGAN